MKKGDIVIIATVLILSVIVLLFNFLENGSGATVKISKDNEIIYEVSINEDRVLELETNTVIIEKGRVWVEKANCKNQICVNHKPIKKTGEVIACLPNNVLVEIE